MVTEKGFYRKEVLTQCLSYGMTWGQISLFLGWFQNIQCFSLSVDLILKHFCVYIQFNNIIVIQTFGLIFKKKKKKKKNLFEIKL
jgi:hypothetical protein